MKALITGDLHCQRGIWVDIVLEYLTYIEEYYKENQIDYIFFAGDMFEKSNKVNHDAFVPFFMKLLEMKQRGIKMIFILGNHDIYNLENNSLVETFSPFGKVVKDYEEIEIEGVDFHFLSYTKDKSLLPEGGDYLITHLDIIDFNFDNEYKAQDPVFFAPDMFKGFKTVFTGHYHRHQKKKNIVYQGGPFQLGFGEAGCEKGFVVLDTDENKWKFEVYDKAPQFIRIPIEEFNDVDVKNKFVSVEITSKVENFVKLKHILYERGAIEITPCFKVEESAAQAGNPDIDFSGSIKDGLREYIESIKVEGIDNKKLLGYFDKVLAEI